MHQTNKGNQWSFPMKVHIGADKDSGLIHEAHPMRQGSGLMAVVDGRASLLEECRLSPLELRNDLAAQFHELLNTSAFLEALPAFLPPDQASQQRPPDLLETLRAITSSAVVRTSEPAQRWPPSTRPLLSATVMCRWATDRLPTVLITQPASSCCSPIQASSARRRAAPGGSRSIITFMGRAPPAVAAGD